MENIIPTSTAQSVPTHMGIAPSKAIDEKVKNAIKDIQFALTRPLQAQEVLEKKMSDVRDLRYEISLIEPGAGRLNKVRHMVVEEIIRVLDGDLVVSDFLAGSKAGQALRLYNGQCWQRISWQELTDFVTKAAAIIGYPDEYRSSAKIMTSLLDDVAFGISRHMCNPMPDDEVWINFANGVLKILNNGELRFGPHCREYYMNYVVPYGFDPEAKAPRWMKTLNQVLPDEGSHDTVQQFVGNIFIRQQARVEKIMVFVGEGSNGKSVILEILKMMFGNENVTFVSLEDLTTNDTKRSIIEHKLLNISTELGGKKVNSANLKKLVSGEPMVKRELYMQPTIMTDYARQICACNELPVLENSLAIQRRLIIVPFLKTFTGAQADKTLTQKLKVELPGILNWAIEGLRKLMANDYNLPVSEACEKALSEYMLQADSVALFVNECCEPSTESRTMGKELYSNYKIYCSLNGLKAVGKQKFNKRMIEKLHIGYSKFNNSPCFDLKFLGQ